MMPSRRQFHTDDAGEKGFAKVLRFDQRVTRYQTQITQSIKIPRLQGIVHRVEMLMFAVNKRKNHLEAETRRQSHVQSDSLDFVQRGDLVVISRDFSNG